MKVLLGAALAAVLFVQSCGLGGTRACTDVGGFSGLSIELPRSLFVTSGRVDVDLCDADGCSGATALLRPVPEGRVGRGVNVTPTDFGRDFEPGPVVVTVTVSDAGGEVVALAEREIELARSYPNGKACDGDGFVVGSFVLERDDRQG